MIAAPADELASLHADIVSHVGLDAAPAALCAWPAPVNSPLSLDSPLGAGAAFASLRHNISSTSHSVRITWGGPTSVLLASCSAASVSARATVSLLNPPSTHWALFSSPPTQGQHLSVSGARQIPLYEGAAVLFGLLAVWWQGTHWAAGARISLLHVLLLAVAITQCLRYATSAAWLVAVASSGDDRAPPFAVATFLEGVARSGSLFVFGLLAHGIGTHQRRPSKRVMGALAAGCLAFLAVILAQIRCSDGDGSGSFPSQCVSLQLGAFLLQCMLALGIVIMGNFNLNLLRSELHGAYTPRTQQAYESVPGQHSLRSLMTLLLVLPTVQLIIQLAALNFRSFWGLVFLDAGMEAALLCSCMAHFTPGALGSIWTLRHELASRRRMQ